MGEARLRFAAGYNIMEKTSQKNKYLQEIPMDFNSLLQSYKSSLGRWKDYRTPARQEEYIAVLLGNIVVWFVIGIIYAIFAVVTMVFLAGTAFVTGSESAISAIGVGISFFTLVVPIIIICIYLFLVQLAASVRRLNDMGQPWYWILLLLIPTVNMIFAIALAFLPSADGRNIFSR